VESTLTDPDGKEIAHIQTSATANPLENTVVNPSMQLDSPRVWSVDDPALYRVRTVVKQDGKPIDEVTTACGFRTIRHPQSFSMPATGSAFS
jgi:beta-galactosidase